MLFHLQFLCVLKSNSHNSVFRVELLNFFLIQSFSRPTREVFVFITVSCVVSPPLLRTNSTRMRCLHRDAFPPQPKDQRAVKLIDYQHVIAITSIGCLPGLFPNGSQTRPHLTVITAVPEKRTAPLETQMTFALAPFRNQLQVLLAKSTIEWLRGWYSRFEHYRRRVRATSTDCPQVLFSVTATNLIAYLVVSQTTVVLLLSLKPRKRQHT